MVSLMAYLMTLTLYQIVERRMVRQTENEILGRMFWEGFVVLCLVLSQK